MPERELRKALFNHTIYCRDQLEKAEKENAKYNGFYSQQYETVQKCKEQGLDFLQYSALQRKAKADCEFWDKEFEIAVKDYYERFKNRNEAEMFALICCQ